MISRCLLRHSLSSLSRAQSIPNPSPSSLVLPKSVHPPLRRPSYKHAPRWYSSSQEAASDASDNADVASREAKQEQTSSQQELESKNQEIIELKDKYLRSVADFRNLQERTKRDINSARDFAISKFARDLLESIDNLDRALEVVPKDKLGKDDSNKDLANLYDGLQMTESILMQTLKKHGLERYDPSVEAEKFNPNLHEATFMTKMDGKEDGTVFMTQQKGFLLNGRVVRAAKVGVVKNS